MNYAHLIDLVSIFQVGICLFCTTFLLTQKKHPTLAVPLGLLLFFQAVSGLPSILMPSPETDTQHALLYYIELATVLLDIVSPLLLWCYVWALTSEDEQGALRLRGRHAAPVVITLCLVIIAAQMPPHIVNSGEAVMSEFGPRVIAGIAAIVALHALMTVLLVTYLTLAIRRLRAYRVRLKDVFASTENRELHWVWLIIVWSILYVLFDVADTVLDFFDVSTLKLNANLIELAAQSSLLGLVWVIGLWGLRQRPVFVQETTVDCGPRPEPQRPKYERSALEDTKITRIAAKITSAMQDDLMYREPNLSLFDLSKHIGVSSHYVSQTLSTKLGSSFFDYVNGWRIKDAMQQLTTTDETVLMIAYDVGFNSRSSFYKAFKRETGKTPSDLRR
ncbi:helix-turn-helix transcriptional regulator [Thalassobius sp. I31.1]|uniref:helix-turn-helix domain-containing protein n=1 Tax=Thalassobius sp. I31.1 TaxID=2109912 RepID=UPI000D198D82|nr:helix-turn-helix transcriptional regulator [Thalassobius sp. I31.1]